MRVTTSKPMPLRLYLIRHGETEWSLSGQYTGLTDIPLTAHGEDTARDLGQRLYGMPFAHVLTSPLQRAQQTCALAGLTPVTEIKPDLAEWDNEKVVDSAMEKRSMRDSNRTAESRTRGAVSRYETALQEGA